MAYVLKVKVRYRNDATGRVLRLPALFTESGLVLSHLRFLARAGGRSQSWRERSTFALMLLIKYINANESYFSQTTELLRAFDDALRMGTIDECELSDPSGLYWQPRQRDDANTLICLITQYTDWLASQAEYETQRANPFRMASTMEQRLNWCAYYNKHDRVFLNHLESEGEAKERVRWVRQVARRGGLTINVEEVKRFPEDQILELLDKGFVRPENYYSNDHNSQVDWKGRAITILMHYGSLRKSEALGIYLVDVVPDKVRNEAIVRVYHPSDGASPDDEFLSRKEYLAQRFSLRPRTEYLKSERLHLGWKNPALTHIGKYFVVNFFPSHKATEFLYVFGNYLRFQRVEPFDFSHPYAFTNTLGEPESAKNFSCIHKAAVERIGLERAKNNGTTEHGHRHAYGYRLAQNGFSQVDIQKAMHHASPDSCLVYINSTNKELNEKMREAETDGRKRIL